jgi:hypothetical protein
LEKGRLLSLICFCIGEENSVIISLNNYFVFKPHVGDQSGTRGVRLHGRLIEAKVPNPVARLNFVDGTCAVFELTRRFGFDAIEIFFESPTALSSI